MHSATIPSLPLFKETSWKYRIHKNMHACSTRDHTRKYLIPARPDPFEFRTRPTLPVQILNPSDPPRTSQNLPEPSPPRAGTLPVGSGRVGLQYSSLCTSSSSHLESASLWRMVLPSDRFLFINQRRLCIVRIPFMWPSPNYLISTTWLSPKKSTIRVPPLLGRSARPTNAGTSTKYSTARLSDCLSFGECSTVRFHANGTHPSCSASTTRTTSACATITTIGVWRTAPSSPAPHHWLALARTSERTAPNASKTDCTVLERCCARAQNVIPVRDVSSVRIHSVSSLDAILSYHIQPRVSFFDQSGVKMASLIS